VTIRVGHWSKRILQQAAKRVSNSHSQVAVEGNNLDVIGVLIFGHFVLAVI